MRARCLVPFLLCLPLFAQTKHPFTFEDMMALKRVEEPVVSPDGKWVLFAAVDVDLKENTKTPHVWVVPLNANGGGTGALARPVEQSSTAMSRGLAHPRSVLATADAKSRAGSSTSQDQSRANDPASVGMTKSEEREIISDQDSDRPRWAPDGKRFAFVSTKENGSQIWIADFDAATGTVTARHRLTNVPTEADGELWSLDGKYILFKSDVYPECVGAAAEEASCNAKKVEEAKESKVKAQIFTHLLYRHWNAYKEGKRTHLFVATAGDCVATAASAVGPGEAGQQSPDKGRAALDRTAEGGCPYASIPRDFTPGDYDAPVFSMGGQDDYAFSPDGKELCYASNHDAMPAASTNNDLFTVPVDWPANATSAQVIAATKNLTAENKAADNTPLYSPDGKYIAYRAQSRPGYESDRWRLMLYDRKTGDKRNLTENWDHWAGSFSWAGVHLLNLNRKMGEPENWHVSEVHSLYLTAEDEGESPIYSVVPEACPKGCYPIKILSGFNDDIAAGELTTSTEYSGVATSDLLVFSRMSLQAPTEVFTYKYGDDVVGDPKVVAMLRGELKEPLRKSAMFKPRQLTHLNDSVLSQVSMSRLEPFWFAGAHNANVEGFLVKPPNFDPSKKYPVKFLIHGGPQGAWGDDWSYRWNAELFAANGYVVIMINFHGSTGYGQKFIDAINGDWGGAPFEDLMKGLDYAEQHYPFIDKDRECALGASYGGWMANWILGHTNRFKCIVSHDGQFNTESAYGDTEELWFPEWEFKGTPWTNREMYRKWSPHLSATNFKTPTLVIHGQRDYRLDVSQGFDLFTTLQRQGVPSKMLYFPDEGHWVLKPQNSQLWYKTVNDWVDEWTKPMAGGQ
jgi:dipeptidyl aminopeptidase/acylaminoacyl peptidase